MLVMQSQHASSYPTPTPRARTPPPMTDAAGGEATPHLHPSLQLKAPPHAPHTIAIGPRTSPMHLRPKQATLPALYP